MITQVTVTSLKNLSSKLWSMKNATEHCDASVIVNGKTIPVHKAVLASASGYFDSFFKNTSQNVVTFQHVNNDALELLIKYCYKGRITITLENADEVLTLARILSMNEILDQSLKSFETTYSFEKCVSRWSTDQLGVVEKLCGNENCILEKESVAVDSTTDDITKMENTSDAVHCISPNTILVAGGSFKEAEKSIEILNLDNEKWEGIEVNFGKRHFAPVFLSDKLFVIGGHNYNTTNSVSCYDLNSEIMEERSPMKHRRRWLSAVQCDGFIFAMGGEIYSRRLSYVEKYDSTTDEWTEVAPMAEPRQQFGIAMLDHDIYVAGGGGYGVYISSAEAYSITKNQWRSCASMHHVRYDFGLAAVRGYLYAVGGFGDDFVASVEMYDSSIDKWTLLDQSLDPARFALAASEFAGKLMIAGGHTKDPLTTVEIFDPVKKIWKSFEPLKQSRSSFNLVKIPWNLAKDLLSKKKTLKPI